jgi:hypothetical protein
MEEDAIRFKFLRMAIRTRVQPPELLPSCDRQGCFVEGQAILPNRLGCSAAAIVMTGDGDGRGSHQKQ